MRRVFRTLLALTIATVIWLPGLRLLFNPDAQGIQQELVQAQQALLQNPERQKTLDRMRRTNPEWDFMGRTFMGLALANLALSKDHRKDAIGELDRLIDETLALERQHGAPYFLLPYGRAQPFLNAAQQSLFVEGEIALMLAARVVVQTKPSYRAELEKRARRIRKLMSDGPVLSGESYPNECWTFCNTVALAALRLSDAALGPSAPQHAELARAWVRSAKRNLVEPKTGLLVSSYTYQGEALDGPEGSSLWLSAHMLQLIDPEFAEDQYRRARRHLGKTALGFGWAREWPAASQKANPDVDSGPIIPIVGASAGSSGLALIAAHSFADLEYEASLLRSMELAAFPIRGDGELRFAASNQVGDAVLLYALSSGPLFELAQSKLQGDAL